MVLSRRPTVAEDTVDVGRRQRVMQEYMRLADAGVEVAHGGSSRGRRAQPLGQVGRKRVLVIAREILDGVDELRLADLGEWNRGERQHLKLVPRALDPGHGAISEPQDAAGERERPLRGKRGQQRDRIRGGREPQLPPTGPSSDRRAVRLPQVFEHCSTNPADVRDEFAVIWVAAFVARLVEVVLEELQERAAICVADPDRRPLRAPVRGRHDREQEPAWALGLFPVS